MKEENLVIGLIASAIIGFCLLAVAAINAEKEVALAAVSKGCMFIKGQVVCGYELKAKE